MNLNGDSLAACVDGIGIAPGGNINDVNGSAFFEGHHPQYFGYITMRLDDCEQRKLELELQRGARVRGVTAPGVRIVGQVTTETGRSAKSVVATVSGEYELPGLPPGQARIVATTDLGLRQDGSFDTVLFEKNVQLKDGDELTLDFPVVVEHGSLRGFVTTGEGNLADALVTVRGPSLQKRTLTDETGAFEFSTLIAGRYVVRAVSGPFTWKGEVHVEPDTDTTLPIVLASQGSD